MTNEVQFDIGNEPRADVQSKTPAMVKLVIKLSGGLIKDEQQANYVLIGFVAVAVVISLFLIFDGGSKIPLPLTPGPDYYAIPLQK